MDLPVVLCMLCNAQNGGENKRLGFPPIENSSLEFTHTYRDNNHNYTHTILTTTFPALLGGSFLPEPQCLVLHLYFFTPLVPTIISCHSDARIIAQVNTIERKQSPIRNRGLLLAISSFAPFNFAVVDSGEPIPSSLPPAIVDERHHGMLQLCDTVGGTGRR